MDGTTVAKSVYIIYAIIIACCHAELHIGVALGHIVACLNPFCQKIDVF